MIRLVIDTDPGQGCPGADIDDALAIGMALRSPEVAVEAITVVTGNVPVDVGVQNTLELLDVAQAPEIAVHRGATRPLVQDPSGWRARLDQRRDDERAQQLWADLARPGSDRRVDPTPAAQALVELADAHPGELTVLAIGPLTNVATAMILDPEWPTKISRLVIMNGAFDLPNVTQELNSAYDPEATHLVYTCAAPLTIVPLDVTSRTFMHLEDVDRLAAAPGPLAPYLAAMVRPWVTWYAERFGRPGCALHDPLAFATLVDPAVISRRSACVDIELHGTLTRGRTVAWDPANPELLSAGLRLPDVRTADIASDVDNDRFMPLLLERLTSEVPRLIGGGTQPAAGA
jgi:inosine-uridine nucleoside N-ribohydrolase